MRDLLDRLRTRLIPAILTAAGVTLIAAGLLTYTNPVEAGLDGSPDPTTAVVPSPSPATSPSDSPGASPSPSPSGSPPPLVVTPGPGPRVATRVVVPALRIDLPVVPGPPSTVYCNVAMFTRELSQPGNPGATYIYAHARTGMFLPLLDQSKRNNGQRMIGMRVEVYTDDDLVFDYEITEVLRGVPKSVAYERPFADDAPEGDLWLQTSEGPKNTPTVLQLVATFVSASIADPKEANPKPQPLVCS